METSLLAYLQIQQRISTVMKIAIVHPDLGIGGAERLIVDAAICLQRQGHSVTIYTSHYDPGHCFPETKGYQFRAYHDVFI
jgi:alpha-1,3/alpha-1,6-mannosyltransferase